FYARQFNLVRRKRNDILLCEILQEIPQRNNIIVLRNLFKLAAVRPGCAGKMETKPPNGFLRDISRCVRARKREKCREISFVILPRFYGAILLYLDVIKVV